MRILVVGAKGFVGASLVRHLLTNGHDVVALDFKATPGRLADVADQIEWVAGDGSTVEAVLAAIGRRPLDGIYYGPFVQHPAGQVGIETELNVMVTAAAKVFQLARGLDVTRLVFPSSTAVHGRQPGEGSPLSENSRVSPFGMYGAAKLLCEEVAHDINLALGARVITCVRLPAIYGPGAAIASRRVNVCAVAAAKGEEGQVDYRRETRVCVAHVDDTGRALASAFGAVSLDHTIYDLGGPDVSFAEILEAVRVTIPDATLRFGDDVDMPLPHAIDNARACRELDVRHRSVVDGMASIVEYERSPR
jgi:nucleoside-diphosphate-sugar epimerase